MPKKAAEAQDIKIGFETDTVRVPLSKITPLKLIAQTVRESEKFQQIVASIREVICGSSATAQLIAYRTPRHAGGA